MEPPLTVERGLILGYRLLDIGDEIRLDQAERRLGLAEGDRRLRLSRSGSEALAFAAPPLDVAMPSRAIALPRCGRTVAVHVTVRLFDFGAASVHFELAIDAGATLRDLLPLCDELYDSPVLEEEARAAVDALVPRLGDALVGSHRWQGVETYTVILVEELRGHPTGEQVMADPLLGKLLLGEQSARPLARGELMDDAKHAYSYLDDDLAVIDWDSAFVLEPSGSRDIPDILEFACAQLFEMRYYDSILGQELDRMYDEVALAGRSPFSLLWSPYPKLARQVQRRWLELTEVTERASNSLKVVGDFYLARVYRGALERFRVPEWQAAVTRKQELIGQIYDMVKADVDTRRSTLLEVTIVLLIVFEIVMALASKTGH